MPGNIETHLARLRRSRGRGAAELARAVGVSRQTIYAIEAGSYVPNTEVALRLARELEVTVEELFTLPPEAPPADPSLAAEMLAAEEPAPGHAVQVGRVGDQWVGAPVAAVPCYLPEADGIVESPGRRRSTLRLVEPLESLSDRVVVAGCDPAAGLLAAAARNLAGVGIVSAAAPSRLALEWLSQGKVHIAGCHLEDPESGEFNLPYLRQQFPESKFTVVGFARWEEGLVVPPGNPQDLRSAADLARPEVAFINRELGSGSRALLDRLLDTAGVPPEAVRGYDRLARGHLAAAYAVLAGDAGCCLATRSAARAFGLGFVPLHTERYDLVMRPETRELPAVRALLDVLQRAALRRQLELLASYDTRVTGTLLA